MLMTGNSPGNDMKFLIEKVEASRNFANKIWNASRFVLMGLDEDMADFELNDSDELNLSDEWILSRLNQVTRDVTENLNKYELGLAADKIYEFVWNEYCDWYIELAKKRLYGEDEQAKATVQKVLITVLKDILKFMHPFMPFITEEIWTHMPETKEALIISDWPTFNETSINEKSIEQMNGLMDAIKNIRIARAKMDVSVKRKAKLLVVAEGEVKENIINNKQYLIDLASCSEVVLADKSEISDDAVSVVIDGGELFMPLADLINFQAEIERLTEEKNEFISEIKRAKGKLSNKGFVNNAPDHLVKEEEEKIEKYEDMLKAVEERIESLKKKL
jgi:valyl-tRNA synthetase